MAVFPLSGVRDIFSRAHSFSVCSPARASEEGSCSWGCWGLPVLPLICISEPGCFRWVCLVHTRSGYSLIRMCPVLGSQTPKPCLPCTLFRMTLCLLLSIRAFAALGFQCMLIGGKSLSFANGQNIMLLHTNSIVLEGNWSKLFAKLFQKYHTAIRIRDHVTEGAPLTFYGLSAHWQLELEPLYWGLF